MDIEPARQSEIILRDQALVADDAIDIAGTALALSARARPGLRLDAYHAHLNALVREVAAAAALEPDGIAARCDALSLVLARRHGYSGDTETYDDVQNADLARVIDRRCGLPVALGILFIHAARKQGWPAEGLNFPGHFLVRLEHEGARAIIDPFNGGIRREAAELRELLKLTNSLDAELEPQFFTPVSNRDILVRLQSNIKIRHARAGDVAGALSVIEDTLLFAPDRPELWHEAGLLNARQGNLIAAIAALETCLARSDGYPGRDDTAAALARLRHRLN